MIEKIEENIARDKRNDALLVEMGWSVIHFWEKEVKRDINKCIDNITAILDNIKNNVL